MIMWITWGLTPVTGAGASTQIFDKCVLEKSRYVVGSGGENGGGRCVVGRALAPASAPPPTLAFARGSHAVGKRGWSRGFSGFSMIHELQ